MSYFEDVLERASRLIKKSEDLNSAFPATREFLESRGLTNIRQLDNQGMRDLDMYLQAYLARVVLGYGAAEA